MIETKIVNVYPTDIPPRYAEPIADRSAKIGQYINELILPNPDTPRVIVIGSRPLTYREVRVLELQEQGRQLVVVGTVVKTPSDGYKSALYGLNTPGTNDITGGGIATDCLGCLAKYRECEEKNGNPIRIKDPQASDSNGQTVAESTDEMYRAVTEIGNGKIKPVVAMPNLEGIKGRISVGAIKIGESVYLHIGREKTAIYGDREVYGGTDGVVVKAGDNSALELAYKKLEIDPSIAELGLESLRRYCRRYCELASSGLVSVDILIDKKKNDRYVVDVTPRVGGATPMQVVAIEAHRQEAPHGARTVLAQSTLYYNMENGVNPQGIIFADTRDALPKGEQEDKLNLVIAAKVNGVK